MLKLEIFFCLTISLFLVSCNTAPPTPLPVTNSKTSEESVEDLSTTNACSENPAYPKNYLKPVEEKLKGYIRHYKWREMMTISEPKLSSCEGYGKIKGMCKGWLVIGSYYPAHDDGLGVKGKERSDYIWFDGNKIIAGNLSLMMSQDTGSHCIIKESPTVY